MARKTINRVAVIGSGVMGSQIACHFANVGIPVLLLDIPSKEPDAKQKAKGLGPDDKAVKNNIVNEALASALKTKPSPVFTKNTASFIQTGNLDDDLPKIKDCDWVIEVVVENLKIKQQVYERIEKFRKEGTLVTSNTSGIPIHLLTEGRSEDFKQHFCGTHFFNPPRYLPLLEIIPTPDTLKEEIDFLLHFGDLILGKTTVLCKDTPAFIGNRIGVFSMMAALRLMQETGLRIDEVDKLTGTLIGHPKSATFRTADVVGIDTLVMVANNLRAACPDDEKRDWFKIPDYVNKLVEEKNLGAKTGAGFYKKIRENGKSEILTLDIPTHTYQPKAKVKLPETDAVKGVEDLKKRLRMLAVAGGKTGDFFRKFHYQLFSYVSHRIPEIADEPFLIDEAVKAGFGWELGPFEIWDVLGLKETLPEMEKEGIQVADWVKELSRSSTPAFYKSEKGLGMFYDPATRDYKRLPNAEAFIVLDNFSENIVWKNDVCTLTDIGDGIVCLNWKTKMNTIGTEVTAGINKAIEIAEADFSGLLLSNKGANFSAGANVGLIFMMATNQDWDELNLAIKSFQSTSMRIRYSGIPVATAPKGLALGGGCEFSLHADTIQAAAETYMGLVETGLGLIPGGGGTKEFTLRASDEYSKGEIELPILQKRLMTIAMARTSTSAEELYELGIFRKGIDHYSMNPKRIITDAKRSLLNMIKAGYVSPVKRNDIKVPGRSVLGALFVGIDSMRVGNYISDHDANVARKLAYVMCGGDLSSQAITNEQYLLDLEREAFLSLCGERKTLERIQTLLTTGKVIRN